MDSSFLILPPNLEKMSLSRCEMGCNRVGLGVGIVGALEEQPHHQDRLGFLSQDRKSVV